MNKILNSYYSVDNGTCLVGFLIQVTCKTSKQQRDSNWRIAAAASVLKEAGTQTLGTYIVKPHAKVAEWLVLMTILEVCDRGTGYEGGGRL